jgi:DNA polymerase III epsilon subunit-like protein
MIIVDVETTGIDEHKHSLLSIGAVDYEKGDEFYIECHAFPSAEIDPISLEINGYTREQCLDMSKPSPVEAYKQFLWWTTDNRNVLLAGQQVGSFDCKFLEFVHKLAGLGKWPFGYRTIDIHSLAYRKFKKSMNLDGILTSLGLEPEPKPHNALTGARKEAEALRLLLNS